MDRQADSGTQLSLPPRAFPRRTLLLGAALLAGTLSGCQIIIGSLLTLQGRPKTTCEFTNMTHGKSLAEKGKKVIVLSTSSASAQSEEPSLDLDIIDAVSRRLKIENVDVVDPHQVGTWIDDNGGIKENTNLEPIGVKFKADYIILFTFTDFGYAEENSPGLYRGRASYKVVVVEMKDSKSAPGGKRAKVIYNRHFDSKYPNRPVAADEAGTLEVFKTKYLARLSQDLTRLFVDYRPEDEIN
ncbi:MAG: hypothetical protein ACM3U2_20645 [Deltaproteobacteria bacterium]